MNETAKDFLTRCFAPGETIALLLRTESPASTQQRVVTLGQALVTSAGSRMKIMLGPTSTWLPIRFALATASAPKRA
jgi:hypothetical protein